MTKDALGNDIILGNWYGFARNQNGRVVIKIGTAKKVTPTYMVTINVFNSLNQNGWIESHISTVKSIMLFPVNPNVINIYEVRKEEECNVN